MKKLQHLAALLPILTAGCASLSSLLGGSEPHIPPATYWVYVGAESADLLHRVRYGPDGAVVERTTPVGELLTELEGPHGLALSPDGRFLYMTTGHGIPDGKLWKIEVGPDTVVGQPIRLGRFPASLALSPNGHFALVANFNVYGAAEASSVSVVFAPEMIEIQRVETCVMPHGSRFSPDGLRHYSVCMMDDTLVEIDMVDFTVARQIDLSPGGPEPTIPLPTEASGAAGTPVVPATGECRPTWVEPAPNGQTVWVACNASDEVLEVDVVHGYILRRLPTGRGAYNVAQTPDGRLLVVTLRQGDAVQFFDLATYTSAAIVPTSGRVVHGVAISPDSRYAFVSVEGVGGEPGRVDIFELATFRRVASVDVGQQAAGIVFWRMEEAAGVASAPTAEG